MALADGKNKAAGKKLLPFREERQFWGRCGDGKGTALRSLLFNIAFYMLTAVWACLLMATVVLPGRGPVTRGVALYARMVIVLARTVAGIRVEVRGRENLPKDGAAIIVSKHMSDLDPIVTLALLPEMTALAKKELFAIPIIGILLRKLGIVRIDRQSGSAHQEMPSVVKHIVETGRPLIVYPEGTRARPGERLKLKSGAFYLQQDGRLPCIPMATNSGLHWPKKSFLRRPGTVVYEIGAPLAHSASKAAFMAELEARVIERSDALMREDPAGRGLVGLDGGGGRL